MSLGILIVGSDDVWPPQYPAMVYKNKVGGTPPMPEGRYVCRQIGGFNDYETGAVIHLELAVHVDQLPKNAQTNKIMGHRQDRDGEVYKQNWFPVEQIGSQGTIKTYVDEETARLILEQMPQLRTLVCPSEDGADSQTYRAAA